jgi:AcrR family transcriptional regulator
MIELVASDGYEALTVRRLAKRARISSGTFYSHYRSTEDCLLSTFDLVCQCASQRMVEAGHNESRPQRRLDLAVNRLFQDMAAAPLVATFMLRGAPAVGPAFTNGLRNSAMRLGVALEFCIRSDNSPSLHPLLLEGMVAGLARIGGLLAPTTSADDDVKAIAAEAVEWISNLVVPSTRVEGQWAAVSPKLAASQPAPDPLRQGAWGEALGDERAMILAAALRIGRRGYHQLTVPEICRKAGVPRRDFNRHFESLEDCFVSALEERATGAIAAFMHKRSASTAGREAAYEALQTLCSGIEADSESARVLFVEITAAGTKGIASRDRLISQAARALRGTAPEGRGPSELAAEASAAAAWVILRRGVQDQSSTMSEALPVLALLMLAPARGGPVALTESGIETLSAEI